MYRRILVALDGSASGDAAIGHAVAIAMRTGAEVELLHVHEHHHDGSLEGLTPYRYEGVTEAENTLDSLDWDDEDKRLQILVERVRAAHDVRIGARVVHGPAPESLTAHADETGVDLIVMSTHGYGGAARRSIGGRVEFTVRHARMPVLLVHPPSEPRPIDELPRFERLLAPYDSSAISLRVQPAVQHLGSELGVRITLLRAIPEGVADEDADRELKMIEAELAPIGTHPNIVVARQGDPSWAILDAAEQMHTDLIAMATHGRSPLGRRVFGSVAARVLRSTAIPVLLFGPRCTRPEAPAAEPARKAIEVTAV